MKWLKLSVDFLQSPKVMAAGRDAALVYLQALVLNSRNGRNGTLTGIEARPKTFANLLAAFDIDLGGASRAISLCVEAGLLEKAGDDLKIVGWDDDWKPRCTTCHGPNEDTTRATCPTCRQKRKARK